jgi:SAM-dependent methyltransferase
MRVAQAGLRRETLADTTRPSAAVPPQVSAQDRVNRRIYHAPNISRWYRSSALDVAETMALLRYQPAFAGREVLDLGVGTGRTSRYLAPLARRYVCVDSSPPMVAHIHAHLPDVEVHLADMRDLRAFASASFDFVLASCNVLDAVAHADRLRVLAEVRRLLRPDGIFMFSSHNRRLRNATFGPRLVRSHNPATQAVLIWRYARSLVNHARVRRLRRIERDYALLNDSGHDYAALHYYVDRDTQRLQLERAGFRVRDVLDRGGRPLQDGDDDSENSSLLYIAQHAAR